MAPCSPSPRYHILQHRSAVTSSFFLPCLPTKPGPHHPQPLPCAPCRHHRGVPQPLVPRPSLQGLPHTKCATCRGSQAVVATGPAVKSICSFFPGFLTPVSPHSLGFPSVPSSPTISCPSSGAHGASAGCIPWGTYPPRPSCVQYQTLLLPMKFPTQMCLGRDPLGCSQGLRAQGRAGFGASEDAQMSASTGWGEPHGRAHSLQKSGHFEPEKWEAGERSVQPRPLGWSPCW